MTAKSNPFVLYGAERSYFTGKVRPALLAKGVSFEEVLPTRDVYDELYQRVYRRMYSRLRSLYQDIREITGYPGRTA